MNQSLTWVAGVSGLGAMLWFGGADYSQTRSHAQEAHQHMREVDREMTRFRHEQREIQRDQQMNSWMIYQLLKKQNPEAAAMLPEPNAPEEGEMR